MDSDVALWGPSFGENRTSYKVKKYISKIQDLRAFKFFMALKIVSKILSPATKFEHSSQMSQNVQILIWICGDLR